MSSSLAIDNDSQKSESSQMKNDMEEARKRNIRVGFIKLFNHKKIKRTDKTSVDVDTTTRDRLLNRLVFILRIAEKVLTTLLFLSSSK